MVTHVAMQTTPTPTDLRVRRAPVDAYNSTSEATAAPPPARATAPEAAQESSALPPVSPEALQKAVDDLSKGVQNLQRSLQFSVDERSGRTVIKVVDKDTKEVIRQIPEEQVLELAARLEERHAGMFVQDEA